MPVSNKGKPHILIINPDEWRGDVLSHMGNPAAVTPNLDAMVRSDAVSFRNAFVQNPVCTPSRCSFMTGWYPHTRGHRTMFHMLRSGQGETNLLKVLRSNGYFVWWGGRNDLVPTQNGYDEFCDLRYHTTPEDYARWGADRQPDLHSDQSWRGSPGGDNYYSFYAGKLDKGDAPFRWDHDWGVVTGATEFIRQAPRDKPLCMFVALGYPHCPYGVEEPWYSAIDRSGMPARIREQECTGPKPVLLDGIRKNQNLRGWTEDRWTELRATYYGMCARVDHQIGLILSALRESGLYDDTAIFIFSDHGDFAGDYGLVEKDQNTFEDCLSRVPLLIKPPRQTGVKPRVTDAMTELVDFPATVYDLCGIEPGYSHFGRSLLPVVSGRTDEHRDAVFCEGGRLKGERQAMEWESTSSTNPTGLYWPRISLQCSDENVWHGKATMCRTLTHKYVRRLYESDELYDLRADPGERHNRINDPALASTLDQLRDRMLRWYQETCDVVPFDADMR